MKPSEPAPDRRRPASHQSNRASVEWCAFRRLTPGRLPLAGADISVNDPGPPPVQWGGADRVAEGAHRRKTLLGPLGQSGHDGGFERRLDTRDTWNERRRGRAEMRLGQLVIGRT